MRVKLPRTGNIDPGLLGTLKPNDIQKLHEERLKISLYFDDFELEQLKNAKTVLESKATYAGDY